jgi:hypothetical protein
MVLRENLIKSKQEDDKDARQAKRGDFTSHTVQEARQNRQCLQQDSPEVLQTAKAPSNSGKYCGHAQRTQRYFGRT